MLSGYHIWTLSHKTSSLKTIGDYTLHGDAEERNEVLTGRKKAIGAEELMYVQTCNRIIYLVYADHPIRETLGTNLFFPSENGAPTGCAFYRGKGAVRHFFEVASSLDSLVVGEREITGQLKKAYHHCREFGLSGDNLRILMKSAVVAAKDVFSSTRLGEKSVSVVSLAFDALLSSGISKDARILLVGAGDTIELVCKFLGKYGFRDVNIFNRTRSKAEPLAQKTGGCAHSLSRIKEYTGGFDALISCTSASSQLLDRSLIDALLQGETGKKYIIDLAVPCDCDSTLRDSEQFDYLHLADLKERAQRNLESRQNEVASVRELLIQHLDEFETKHRQRQVVRALRDIPEEIKDIRERALNEVFEHDLEQLDPRSRALVERMMQYMEKKCIGIPMKTAREAFSSSE